MTSKRIFKYFYKEKVNCSHGENDPPCFIHKTEKCNKTGTMKQNKNKPKKNRKPTGSKNLGNISRFTIFFVLTKSIFKKVFHY